METIIARVPGRVSVIGDHTDYTFGFCLSAAINKTLTAKLTPKSDLDHLFVKSISVGEECVIDLNNLKINYAHDTLFSRFIKALLRITPNVTGGYLEITSSLPVSSGLSSSAALLIACSLVAVPKNLDSLERALLCQKAEHIATKVNTGLLDQLSILFAKKNNLNLIDLSKNEVCHIRFPDELKLAIIDSHIKRDLANSTYQLRVKECNEIEKIIGPLNKAQISDLSQIKDKILKKRARHVIEENARTVLFAKALKEHDFSTLGTLLLESHKSLRDNYQVSLAQLDDIVEKASKIKGVLGVRLTGAGFGGSLVAVCEANIASAQLREFDFFFAKPVGKPEVKKEAILGGK